MNAKHMFLHIILTGSPAIAAQPCALAGPSFTSTLPQGWTSTAAKGAITAATAPDNTMQIIVWEFPVKDAKTAVEIARSQMKKITYKKIINPPTYMSSLKSCFNADSVAKMAFGRTRSDGADIFYRAFVFVKGGTFVVIESCATKGASHTTFIASDATIETFKPELGFPTGEEQRDVRDYWMANFDSARALSRSSRISSASPGRALFCARVR